MKYKSIGLVMRHLLLALVCCAAGSAVRAQTTNDGTDPSANVSGKSAVTSTLDQARTAPLKEALGQDKPSLSIKPGLLTEVGTGRPVGEGVRVLSVPPKCSPKHNSLDCATDTNQVGQKENVSNRVRNSVIGEVGAARATTEGSGKAKEQATCTPAPGKLTCEPGK